MAMPNLQCYPKGFNAVCECDFFCAFQLLENIWEFSELSEINIMHRVLPSLSKRLSYLKLRLQFLYNTLSQYELEKSVCSQLGSCRISIHHFLFFTFLETMIFKQLTNEIFNMNFMINANYIKLSLLS